MSAAPRLLFPLLAAASAFLLSSCVANGPQRATSDGVNYTVMTAGQAEAVPRCPWRACVLADPGTYANIISDWLGQAFASSVVSADMAGGRKCDVGFRYESLAWGDHSDVISAYTGEKLLHLDGNAKDDARLACSLLMPGKPLGAVLEKQRARANKARSEPDETAEAPAAERTSAVPAAAQAKPWWQN